MKIAIKINDHIKEIPFPSLKKTEARPKEVLDLSKAMEVVAGNREIFKEIANMFLESSPASVTQIREAIAGGADQALERAAHNLKGSIGHFGARRGHLRLPTTLRSWGERNGRSRSCIFDIGERTHGFEA